MFLELASKRYSCRGFQSRPVEKEKLDIVCQAARLAPTGCNKQAPRIFVIQSPETVDKIRPLTHSHYNAPVIILVCYDNRDLWHRSYDNWDTGYTDVASVVTHILLAAAELDLGTCWVGSFDPVNVAKVLNLPDYLVPGALVPIGYADMGPGERHAVRRPLDETVTYL